MSRVDPLLQAAFAGLPPAVQEAAMRNDPHAGRALKAAYLAEVVRVQKRPNRAQRRATARRRTKP